MPTDVLTGEPDGTWILTLSQGICPPSYPGVTTHVCDLAAQRSMALICWYRADDLLDADGHCKLCGERV